MIRYLRTTAFILLIFCFLKPTCALRVMSFNIYMSGSKVENGTGKVAEQIKHVNPDIVTLQESRGAKAFQEIIRFLGKGWSGVQRCHNGDTSIITRHKILDLYEHVSAGVNARIQLKNSGQEISIWSMHLDYLEYGPYAAFEGCSSMEKILRGEHRHIGRVQNIIELMKHPQFVQQIKNADNIPVIVTGDFNVPSHLDWTEETKGMHNNWTVEWPVTKLLSNAAGMTDSFREVHPDPIKKPGLTWTVYREGDYHIAEKDRIDFIFYRGSLRAKSSETFAGTTPIIDDGTNAWRKNEWPSDHWAVVTDFEYIPHKYEKTPTFDINPEYIYGNFNLIDKCHMEIIE